MSLSQTLGDRKTATTSAGTIEYRERGSGPPIVFAHGVGVNGDLWRRVAPALAADGHRTIVPDLPLGAHSIPLEGEPDMSLPGLADILAGFVEALDLTEAAKRWLGRVGYDPVYGARPLKRAVQRYLQDPLAEKLLAGEVPDGSAVRIDEGDGGLTMTVA